MREREQKMKIQQYRHAKQTIQKQSYKMDTHTHYGLKTKDLPEDAEEEQKADIKSADKLQEAHQETPGKKPVKTRTL